jgi:hypothetical protein
MIGVAPASGGGSAGSNPAGGATSDLGLRLFANNPTVLFVRFLGPAVERTESTDTRLLQYFAPVSDRSRVLRTQLPRLRGREKAQVQA